MIAALRGKIISKRLTEVILDVNGVGYKVYISLQTSEQLPETGKEASLITYLNVREDALQLYGFMTESEHELFKQLISVNGIGPKVAVSILSATKVDEFIQYVVTANLKVLTTVPGVGKKTAERIIVELKDKLAKMSSTISSPTGLTTNQAHEDAVSALISLGFTRAAAEKAMTSIVREKGTEISTEEIIRLALRQSIK